MKKQIALFTLVAAAFISAPAIVHAENSTNAPAADPAKKHGTPPIHGKVSAVDSAAMTLTVGETTIVVTSKTQIMKDGKPATLSDITAGESVVASGKKDESGKFNATKISVGEKAAKKAKKKAADAGASSTNAPAQ